MFCKLERLIVIYFLNNYMYKKIENLCLNRYENYSLMVLYFLLNVLIW